MLLTHPSFVKKIGEDTGGSGRNDLGVAHFVLIPTHTIYAYLGVVQLGEFRPRARAQPKLNKIILLLLAALLL